MNPTLQIEAPWKAGQGLSRRQVMGGWGEEKNDIVGWRGCLSDQHKALSLLQSALGFLSLMDGALG